MRLKVTPTVDGELSKQFTTLIDQKTGKAARLTVEEALYWGNRAIQVNEDFCNGDKDFTVKMEFK